MKGRKADYTFEHTPKRGLKEENSLLTRKNIHNIEERASPNNQPVTSQPKRQKSRRRRYRFVRKGIRTRRKNRAGRTGAFSKLGKKRGGNGENSLSKTQRPSKTARQQKGNPRTMSE